MSEGLLRRWENFLYEQFGNCKWPEFFVLFDWIQQKLMCKLRLCQECSHCQTYVCPWCGHRVPWSNGCADDMPEACDECWAEAHNERKVTLGVVNK